ncbi:MAG: hypothetical protein M5T61_18950 [Acidimicrobiia bacterium]|nr:hypothetical protein [Acidimicrobiia bacterium]
MRTRADRAAFEQLFHFRYADGARMLTRAVSSSQTATDEPSSTRISTSSTSFGEEPPRYELAPPALTPSRDASTQ